MIPKVGDKVLINPKAFTDRTCWPEIIDAAAAKTPVMILSVEEGLNPTKRAGGSTYIISFKFSEKNGCLPIRSDGTLVWDKDGKEPVFIPLISINLPAPRNNDGRTECFWCVGVKTAKRGSGRYDVCPKCGK